MLSGTIYREPKELLESSPLYLQEQPLVLSGGRTRGKKAVHWECIRCFRNGNPSVTLRHSMNEKKRGNRRGCHLGEQGKKSLTFGDCMYDADDHLENALLAMNYWL